MEKTYETLGGWRKFYIGYLWFTTLISTTLIGLIMFYAGSQIRLESALAYTLINALYIGLIYISQKAIQQRKTGLIFFCSLPFIFFAPFNAIFHWMAAWTSSTENQLEQPSHNIPNQSLILAN